MKQNRTRLENRTPKKITANDNQLVVKRHVNISRKTTQKTANQQSVVSKINRILAFSENE